MDLKEKVITEIKKIYDPEIPVNIVELGLIYDLSIQDPNIKGGIINKLEDTYSNLIRQTAPGQAARGEGLSLFQIRNFVVLNGKRIFFSKFFKSIIIKCSHANIFY